MEIQFHCKANPQFRNNIKEWGFCIDMEKISIIGAGWMGLPLGAELVRMGYVAQGSTTREEKLTLLQEKGLSAFVLDSATATQEHLAPLMQCDVLIVTVPPRGNEEEYGNFMRLLATSAAREGVEKVIYTSATSVYPDNNQVVTEDDAQMIVSSHSGIRLLAMENIFREHKSLRPTILRFGGLFGPGRQPARWLSGRTGVAGADSPVNMIHLDDCIGVVKAVLQKQAWGQTFNAVSPEHPTRKEFYRRACAAAGLEPPQWNEESKSWKMVSAQNLCDKLDYSFTYPDPSLAF